MSFTESMRAFVAEVERFQRDCAGAVADVRTRTMTLRQEARAWMDGVSRENHQRGEKVHRDLAEHRQQRRDYMQRLREQFHEVLQEMRQETAEMLRKHQDALRQQVHKLMHEFNGTRKNLAEDLRGSGRIWRDRARS